MDEQGTGTEEGTTAGENAPSLLEAVQSARPVLPYRRPGAIRPSTFGPWSIAAMVALAEQFFAILFGGTTFDDGVRGRLFLVAAAAFWLGAGAFLIRWRPVPTAGDMLYMVGGYPLIGVMFSTVPWLAARLGFA